YILSMLGSAAVVFCAVPFWRKWCLRVGLIDDPGHRKIHAQPIPLAGGLAVLTGLLLPWVFGALALNAGFFTLNTVNRLLYGLEHRAWQLGAVLLGALGITLLGWVDDKHELRPGLKFTGQLVVAVLVASTGLRISLFVPNVLFSYLVTILWILTLINAFNFMDNMNGLCSGLGTICALWFGIEAALLGQYLVAAVAFLCAGALAGFLPFNFPKASVFLGDSGSHLVGYLMAVLAILPHFYSTKHPKPLAVLSPLLILAVPLVDLAWVVCLRWKAGKPFYVGDTNHLSHRLVRCGLTHPQAVLVIWALALSTGLLSLLLQ
ncbi:MAG TPA: MraY family glycosyltransferase, partial [Candidatus Saccharimonadales bacterium]|nr:MraY family glycosyltransferase [Candidatus Saccharimonadales bacterium]